MRTRVKFRGDLRPEDDPRICWADYRRPDSESDDGAPLSVFADLG